MAACRKICRGFGIAPSSASLAASVRHCAYAHLLALQDRLTGHRAHCTSILPFGMPEKDSSIGSSLMCGAVGASSRCLLASQAGLATGWRVAARPSSMLARGPHSKHSWPQNFERPGKLLRSCLRRLPSPLKQGQRQLEWWGRQVLRVPLAALPKKWAQWQAIASKMRVAELWPQLRKCA